MALGGASRAALLPLICGPKVHRHKRFHFTVQAPRCSTRTSALSEHQRPIMSPFSIKSRQQSRVLTGIFYKEQRDKIQIEKKTTSVWARCFQGFMGQAQYQPTRYRYRVRDLHCP
ncbi:hypothetical protein POX_a01110 [Penicillium oxalicum]|uniref:hypothetical protein n=1 Tax=Penicillium oxalicum TaxID=69781 RepID=UPI0020B7670E|nr:hypothetical protein POX_a01110 [Penicillium oxalicum]KAI2794511.1 hypothetical protein POX_a01110 [Penicillium oxalicum]